MAIVERRTSRQTIDSASFRKIVPVKWWAGLGAVALTAQAALLMHWMFGPFFNHVQSGPDPVPDWMKVGLVAIQVILPLAGIAVVWHFLIRPWRREKRLTVDGLLVGAFATLWVQDPMSAYGGEWYAYNAWLVNMGSWTNSVPGWLSPASPEHQIAYPLLVVPGAYICIFILVSFLGATLMRRLKARRPQMGRLALVACCYVAMCLFDVVFEGIVFMPLGAWEYPGGHLSIFDSTYHAYPIHEALTTGMIFTAFASIKFFLDDRGQTFAERGSEALSAGSNRRQWGIRLLAVTGLVQLAMFLGYTVPNFVVGLHGADWNNDIQSRSYLTYTCGPEANRPCPPSPIKEQP